MPSANLNRLKREEVRLLCQTLDVLRTMRNLKIYNCSSSNNLNCLKKIIRLIKHLHDKNQLTQKIQIWALASMRFALTWFLAHLIRWKTHKLHAKNANLLKDVTVLKVYQMILALASMTLIWTQYDPKKYTIFIFFEKKKNFHSENII
jgi:hypothetical protein